ncbi:hypothetical protein IWW54_001140 [Coemansia sp. RSA 2705]|nr:hypothetical protein IWW54_001140 [Coemansia sp. RSA 2705]
MSRRSTTASCSSTPFSVFTDATPKPARPAKARFAGGRHGRKSPTHGCAVLQELNTNKPFTLSPNSQICAEKENFDPIRKQLVAYKRSKSQARPLGEQALGQQPNKPICASRTTSSRCGQQTSSGTQGRKARVGLATAAGSHKQRPPDPRKSNPSVDDLVLLLSDIDIEDSNDTPCRPRYARSNSDRPPGQPHNRKLPPPVLRLTKQSKAGLAKHGMADLKSRGAAAPGLKESSPNIGRDADRSLDRKRRPAARISAVTSPPDLKHGIR